MKIGLALSGGGVKGAAHIGVLRCLHENQIPVDLISGASAGSIVAGLYASGLSLPELTRFALRQNKKLLDYDIPGIAGTVLCPLLGRKESITGFVKGARLNRVLTEATGGKTLSQAVLPLAISATDIQSGQVILFVSSREGLHDSRDIRYLSGVPIADAISASAAIPIVFQARTLQGHTLVDGGVLEDIPVNVLYAMGADIVIAVDLSRVHQTKPVRGFIEVAHQTLSVMGRRMTELRTVRAQAIIAPDLSGIGTFDFEDIPLCMKRGYEAAAKAMDSIKKAMIQQVERPKTREFAL